MLAVIPLNELKTKLIAGGEKEEYPPDILHYLTRPCGQLEWWEILTCYLNKRKLEELFRNAEQ